jgi:peptidase U32
MKKIELLAPAGNLEILKVAIQAGANAVYLAGKNFGARSFSQNFTNDEMIEAVHYAHLRNAKVYITVNTIVYNEEFNELKEYIHFLYTINVDALIIQDLGVLRWIRMTYPDFEIHASTQMNIYDQNGALQLKNSGVKRVVLARETPLYIAQEIVKTGIEVEIFIHGALCFCASGNCLMSFAIGKRSGNRGKCAQPCRKKYILLEDGKQVTKASALLSMKDLNTISNMDEIIDSGVSSLKIEGRMKSKEYVYAVVKSYREIIDQYYQTKKIVVDPIMNERLLVTFNRGFTKGYLFQEKNRLITNINRVNHQGIVIGKVIHGTRNFIEIKLTKDLSLKDAIRITGVNEIGFVVNKMFINGMDVKIAKAGDIVKLFAQNSVKIGAIVVKTKDSQIEREVISLLNQENVKEKIVAKLTIHYMEKPILELIKDDVKVVVMGKIITEFSNKPMHTDFFCERLNKTKDTPFIFQKVIVDYDNQAYLSIKELNELRRNALEQLSKRINCNIKRENIPYYENPNTPTVSKNSTIEAIVHNKEQYAVCKELGIDVIYTDFESQLKNKNRLMNDLNEGLVQNLGNVSENSIISSYFNVVNHEAVLFLMGKGANKVYLSNELEINQLKEFRDIAKRIDLGIMVYGKMDLMITKHCFISKAKGHMEKKCQECINHEYQLVDEYNNKMDVFPNPYEDCSLRILDSNTRDWYCYIEQLKKFNIKKFLFVFTIESREQVKKIIKKYQKAL